jgi:hypothetical protein
LQKSESSDEFESAVKREEWHVICVGLGGTVRVGTISGKDIGLRSTAADQKGLNTDGVVNSNIQIFPTEYADLPRVDIELIVSAEDTPLELPNEFWYYLVATFDSAHRSHRGFPTQWPIQSQY